jgi:hypothetical protein
VAELVDAYGLEPYGVIRGGSSPLLGTVFMKNISQQDLYYAVAHRSDEEINSFSSRYEDFQTELIPDIFKKSLGWKVDSFRKSDSWGSSHVIFFVSTPDYPEEVVLRSNLGMNEIPEGVMEVEKLITKDLKKIGLRTNQIIFSDVSRINFPFDFQIQTKLNGLDPEVSFNGSRRDYDKISYQLGEYVARYHQLQYPLFGRFNVNDAIKKKLVGTKDNFYKYIVTSLDFDLEKLFKFKLIKNKDIDNILTFFEKQKDLINHSKGVLNHHDLADHNLMYDQNGLVGVFDWEAAVVGDPVLDLASCPTWRTLYPREEQLLSGYKSISKLPDNFHEKKQVYFLRTMIWKAVYAVRMNIMTKDRKEKFDKALFQVGI